MEESIVENLNIVEILKLGLPGLVFLLSMLSYRLLSKEEEKQQPSHDILSSIKLFMSINVVLAVLTLASPIIDHTFFSDSKPFDLKTFDLEAKIGVASLEQGKAEVCHDAEYKNTYLLVKDETTEKLIQVFASSFMPCRETKQIRLNEKDINLLGWNPGTSSQYGSGCRSVTRLQVRNKLSLKEGSPHAKETRINVTVVCYGECSECRLLV